MERSILHEKVRMLRESESAKLHFGGRNKEKRNESKQKKGWLAQETQETQGIMLRLRPFAIVRLNLKRQTTRQACLHSAQQHKQRGFRDKLLWMGVTLTPDMHTHRETSKKQKRNEKETMANSICSPIKHY